MLSELKADGSYRQRRSDLAGTLHYQKVFSDDHGLRYTLSVYAGASTSQAVLHLDSAASGWVTVCYEARDLAQTEALAKRFWQAAGACYFEQERLDDEPEHEPEHEPELA